MITTISNSNLIAIINHLGAELISLRTKEKKEYIWEGNPKFWGKHSPILFPIVGTLKNNTYLFNGVEYHLSRHGFARDMEFTLAEKKENSVTLSLESNSETLLHYPFEFELQIQYTLEDATLEINYCVINKSDNRFPFSIGAHPAFALPGNFEDYTLAFEKIEPLEYTLLENDLVSSQTEIIESNNIHIDHLLLQKWCLIRFNIIKR